MINVKEVAFFAYPVTDISRAKAFYETLLGLKSSSAFEHEGKHWVEYDIGPSTIAISNFAPDWKPGPQGGSVALEVENFEETITTLKKAGTPFLVEATQSPVCQMAVIADPDGNSLVIHRRSCCSQHG